MSRGAALRDSVRAAGRGAFPAQLRWIIKRNHVDTSTELICEKLKIEYRAIAHCRSTIA